MKHPTYRSLCNSISHKAMDQAFLNRKGHGGGECTRRVLYPNQLREIIERACREVADEVARYERGAPDMVRASDTKILAEKDHVEHAARLSGSCADGAERDAGKLIHSVSGAWFDGFSLTAKARCGIKPGRRSALGFVQTDDAITCEKCK